MDAVAHLNTALAGRYTVEREIGRGGMAVVYLARDVRHNRRVALKTLNPELGAVLGAERFLSEIQVTANLQHPNLLPLFDSGEAEGVLFYVMPYIEGESLRAKLLREKQLPLDDAIHIATAVAGALQYAHQHGIVHRDLKPENILLQGSEPLVADFGIALAVSNAGGSRITQTGISLGTPHYMSPEQATGDRAIDARADVYSLGAMTYEMLVGDPPHTGSTAQAIIAKVLTERPTSVRTQRATVPAHVDAALDRALAKLPADRYPSAMSFAEALMGRGVTVPPEAIASGMFAAPAPRSRRRQWLSLAPWVGLAAALGIFGTAAVQHWTERALPLRFTISMPASERIVIAGNFGSPVAISPDGRIVVYSGQSPNERQLYARPLDQLSGKPLPGTERARSPVFSPDGRNIAFFADGQLKVVPTSGGAAVAVAELVTPFGMTWTTNEEIVFAKAAEGMGSVLFRVNTSSRQARAFTALDSVNNEGFQYWPAALEDGKTVLFASIVRGNLRDSRIAVASTDRGRIRVLDLLGTQPLGVVKDRLIYVRGDGSIMAAPFNTRSLEVTGTPFPLGEEAFAAYGGAAASMSRTGALAYVQGTNASTITVVDEKGSSRAFVNDRRRFGHPRLSPDGRRLAVDVSSATASDIWIYETSYGTLTKLTTSGTNDRPEWTPDGKRVMFAATLGGLFQLSWQLSDGSGGAEVLLRTAHPVREVVSTPDGRVLLYREDHPTRRRDIHAFSLVGDRTPAPVIATVADELMPRVSPDGKWLAYVSDEPGRYEVYVRPFPGVGARYQISDQGGMEPLWSPDGRRIFYRKEEQLIAASIETAPTFAVVRRQTLFTGDYTRDLYHANYDVMRDGKHFVMLRPSDDLRIVVALNWVNEAVGSR